MKFDKSDIGKRFQLLVTANAHPYCKFVKDAPENGYVCLFAGVLQTIFDDKWEQGFLVRFVDVEFEKRKQHQKRKHWDLYLSEIIECNVLPFVHS